MIQTNRRRRLRKVGESTSSLEIISNYRISNPSNKQRSQDANEHFIVYSPTINTMAQDAVPHVSHDPESQTTDTSNEETPLLTESTEHESDHEEEEDVPAPEKKEPSWYIWRISWAIFAALVLAVFIKGWVDSGGDVEVGHHGSMSHNSAQLTL